MSKLNNLPRRDLFKNTVSDKKLSNTSVELPKKEAVIKNCADEEIVEKVDCTKNRQSTFDEIVDNTVALWLRSKV